MDKRYQVFISSTFKDLIEERQAVLKAVLELDQMPGGMELFPASDDTAWQLIKDVIDGSDYYVVIIGGRYGSLDDAGIGYTEKEYDYAVLSKKPVIPLLHEDPDNLPRDKTETDEIAWEKLKAFRLKVEKRHTCVYWKTVEELKAKVIVGLTAAMKRHPSIGWVRADKVAPEATVREVLALRTRISELEKEADEERVHAPEGTEDLLQGDDDFDISVTFMARKPSDSWDDRQRFEWNFSLTWNEIFGAVALNMINEASDADVRNAFCSYFEQSARELIHDDENLKEKLLTVFEFRDDEIDTCILQLRALGLIRESMRQRSLRDTNTYWTLTPYGDYVMTRLRALRKTATKTLDRGDSAKPDELLAPGEESQR